MDLRDRDIEELLDIAGDDGGRPLSFGIDDVVRQGRRRTRIRRTGALTAAVITTAVVASGAVVWTNGSGTAPAGRDQAPVSGASSGTVTADRPRLLPDDTWVDLGGVWFRGFERVSHTPGVLSGVVVEFSDRALPGHGPYAAGVPYGAEVLEKPVVDGGWFFPMTSVAFTQSKGETRTYPLALVRGDVRSGVFTETTDRGTVRIKAVVYRLGTLRGWTMLIGAQASSGHSTVTRKTVEAYDGSGNRVLHCSASAAGSNCDR